MKKEQTEPLIELFYQEFPNKDPLEIERMVNTVKKWLEQELARIKRDTRTLSKNLSKDIDPNNQANVIELESLIHQLKKTRN